MKSSSHSSQSSVSDCHGHTGTPQHHGTGHTTQQGTSTSGLFNSHHFNITNPMNSFFFESFSNISPNHSVFDDTDDDDDEFGSFEQVRVWVTTRKKMTRKFSFWFVDIPCRVFLVVSLPGFFREGVEIVVGFVVFFHVGSYHRRYVVFITRRILFHAHV